MHSRRAEFPPCLVGLWPALPCCRSGSAHLPAEAGRGQGRTGLGSLGTARVFAFLPGLATESKTWPYTVKKASAGGRSSLPRDAWRGVDGLMGSGVFSSTFSALPSLLQVPWRQLRRLLCSVAEGWGLQRGWLPQPVRLDRVPREPGGCPWGPPRTKGGPVVRAGNLAS